MTDRYTDIVNRCLAHEDKSHRDQILAELPPHQADIVRRMIHRIGQRFATYVARGQTRADRNERLAAIREPWLRERVRAMVIERYAQKREAG